MRAHPKWLALALEPLALGVLIAYQVLAQTPSPTPVPTAAGLPVVADTIEGFVYEADGLVAGATVRVRATDNKTTTAADGSFTLSGLTATTPVSVTARAEGYFVGWTSAAPGPEPIAITLKPYYTTDNPDYGWFSMEQQQIDINSGIDNTIYL